MKKNRMKLNYRRRVLRLPDLDHCKTAVLNSLGSPASRRVYEYAIDQLGAMSEKTKTTPSKTIWYRPDVPWEPNTVELAGATP